MTRQTLSIFILLTLVFFSLNSCKKTDIIAQVPEINYEEKFFFIPEGTNPAVIRIVNKIKEQNNQYHLVNNFVKKHGLPKWEHALLQPRKNRLGPRASEQDGNDMIVLIPVANELEAKIKDVLACDVNATDVVIKLIEDYTYKYYGYDLNAAGQASAKDIAAMFMKFETKVYNRRIFEIKDVELAKKILGDQWQDELTNLILKEDTSSNEIGFYRTTSVMVVPAVSTPNYVELPEVIITPAPGGLPIIFPGLPTIAIDGGGWWWTGSGGPGGTGSGGGYIGGGSSGGGTGTPGSNGSGGGNNNEEPGWEEPPCGGHWEGDQFIKLICNDQKDENGYYYSRLAELSHLLEQNPSALEPCDEINKLAQFGTMYQNVATVQVPQSVIDRIQLLNESYKILTNGQELFTPFQIQTLENATGTVVNSDFFPVQIKQLPPGFSASSLLEYFRLHINEFTSDIATFEPLRIDINNNPIGNPFIDETVYYNSSFQSSIGALVHINMADNGTVVESDYYQDYCKS